MSITDELREYFGKSKGMFTDHVLAIADRIDAEHEKATSEFWQRINAVPVTDETMAEYGWVRLPKDADGVPIHIGDVMAYEDNTKPMEVVAIVPPVIFLTEDGPRYADMCRHYHAPTVEDVLREFALAVCKDEALTIRKGVVEEYAKRLTLAEGEG